MSCISSFEGGVRITVRAKPGVSKTKNLSVVDIGNGKFALEVSVAARAVEGKANKAIVEKIAEAFGVPKKNVRIKSGETGRIKVVEVLGDAAALRERI